MKVLRALDRLFDQLLEVLLVISGVLAIFLMLGISTEVVTRYFFNMPIVGMLESSEMALLYICFLAAAWTLREEGHVSMDAITHRMNTRPRAILFCIQSLVGAVICVIIIRYGIKVTAGVFEAGTLLPGQVMINMGYLLLIIPLGSIPLLIQFLRRAYGHGKLIFQSAEN